MARKETITYTYTDDLTGEEVDLEDLQTIFFSYEGADYSIDLGKASLKKLDAAVAPFIDKAERVRARNAATAAKPKRSASRPGINLWGRENGFPKGPGASVPGIDRRIRRRALTRKPKTPGLSRRGGLCFTRLSGSADQGYRAA